MSDNVWYLPYTADPDSEDNGDGAGPAAARAIAARYGAAEVELDVWNDVLEVQLGHRSVRLFLPDRVSEAELTAIVAAAQSAPTSSNLQAWSVVAVRDPARKARLARLAGDQNFVRQAPLFLVWLADLGRHRRLAARHDRPLEAAEFFEATLLGVIDAALAAQNAVVSAESLGLGTVYVGAIRNQPEQVADELGLPPHVFAVFGLAVGRPDPAEAAGVKPRLPQTAVLHRERYDATVGDSPLRLYDQRLQRYNASYGLPGAWTDRVLQRLAGPSSLKGRDRIREALVRLGWPSR